MNHNSENRIIEKQFRLLLPINALATTGLSAINTLINCIIVGRFFGENALAAIGFVNPLNAGIMAIFGVLSIGGQICGGNFLGRGDRKGLNSVFSTVLTASFIIGLIFSIVMLLIPENIAKLLGASGEITSITSKYIYGMGIGAIFTIALPALIMFLQMEQKRMISSVCMIIVFIINLIGNIINVLFLKLGIFGVSFFMSIGSMVAVVVALYVLLAKGKILRFLFKSISFNTFDQIIKSGFPYAVSLLAWMVGMVFINRYAFILGGTVGMAALTVAKNISAATGSIVESGNNSSTFTLASVLIGEKDISSLRALPKVTAKVSLPLFFAAYVFAFVFAKQLALLMGANYENLDIYINAIRLMNLWNFPNAFIMPLFCIYQSMGKIKLTTVLGILNGAVLSIFVCTILSKFFGFNAIISTFWINQIIMLILYMIIFIVKAKRLPKSLFGLCYIPSTISVSHENRIKSAITTLEEAEEASKKMHSFCIEKGLPTKTAYFSGLCVEEIAVDTIMNRFSKQNSSIDFRAIYEEGHLTILLRDDCTYFDPKAWLELCTPEEKERSIGIKLVMSMAEEVSSVRTLGLNVLKIKL